MKQVLLIVIGLLPLPIGYGLNVLIMSEAFAERTLPYGLIGLLFLLGWFLLGLALRRLARSTKQAVILAHVLPLIALLLLLVQSILLGHYWSGAWALATQFYYLPLLRIAAPLTSLFHTMAAAYLAAFLLMCGSFYLGCRAHDRLLSRDTVKKEVSS